MASLSDVFAGTKTVVQAWEVNSALQTEVMQAMETIRNVSAFDSMRDILFSLGESTYSYLIVTREKLQPLYVQDGDGTMPLPDDLAFRLREGIRLTVNFVERIGKSQGDLADMLFDIVKRFAVTVGEAVKKVTEEAGKGASNALSDILKSLWPILLIAALVAIWYWYGGGKAKLKS